MNRVKNFVDSGPILYIVATPIGNLQEMSPRAIEVLNSVAIIGCEDTRNSRQLFEHFQIKKPLYSCHEHNEEVSSNYLLNYLKEGHDVAYVSDAGYPGISDPGHRLIVNALDANYKVSVISGSNALLNALIGSGLESDHFYFHGFLPSKKTLRIKELEELSSKKETMIFYESPHRIIETLKDMLSVLGNRKCCIARELTKKFEEYIRSDLESLVSLSKDDLKGEMVLVIEGSKKPKIVLDDNMILTTYQNYLSQGMSSKDAIKEISESLNVNKNYVYKLIINNKI